MSDMKSDIMSMETSIDKPKIALEIMYDGTRFHGWQVQKNSVSVQSTLQDAFQTLVGFRPDISGCSRTDAGVHADSYVCHLNSSGIRIPVNRLPAALNTALRSSGIAVKNAAAVSEDFHARYSCTSKEYIYKIWNAQFENPFLENRALFFPRKADFEKYSHLFSEFCGTHDFRAFMSKGSKNENNTIRTVKYFDFTREGNLITFRVCADGFLYNMVRIMTGTILKLCSEGASSGAVCEIIDSLDRTRAGDTAPAHGLYLNRVFYDTDLFYPVKEV